jgi:acyl-coenzyme A thioesterase PaaI-like protein
MTTTQPLVLDRSWWSYAGPHGGFLASRLLAAATDLTEHPPRSLHVQFVAAAEEGPADIDATVVREGRSATFVDAMMSSGDRLVAKASIVLGAARPGPAISASPPFVEALENLAELNPPVDFVPFSQHLEYRPSGDNGGLASGRAQIFGWIKFRDDRPLDEVAATVLVDAPPPALYGALVHMVPVPTADLYVQYAGGAARADDPWSLVRIVTSAAGDGWCVDDSEVWDRTGRLIATARQTRLVLGSAA